MREYSILKSIVTDYLTKIGISSLSEEWLKAISQSYSYAAIHQDSDLENALDPIVIRIISGVMAEVDQVPLSDQSLPLLRAAAQLEETRMRGRQSHVTQKLVAKELKEQELMNQLSFLPGTSLQDKLNLMKAVITFFLAAFHHQSQELSKRNL